MRHWHACATVLLLLAMATPGMANVSDGPLEVFVDRTVLVGPDPSETLHEQGPAALGCDSAGNFSRLSNGWGFRFREEADEHGCLEVRFDIDVPGGAEWATISFFADRNIKETVQGQLAVSMRQQFGVVGDRVDDVFHRYDPSARLESYSYEHALHGKSLMRVAWTFSDDGRTEQAPISAPGAGAAFSATVSRAVARFHDIPVPVTASTDLMTVGEVDELRRHTVRFTVEPGAASHDLRLVPREATIVAVLGPQGAITEQLFGGLASGGFRLEDAPPGAYQIILETRSVRNTVFLPLLPAIAAITPIAATVGAAASHRTWAPNAHPTQIGSIRRSRVALGVLAMGALGFAAYTSGAGAQAMGQAPTSATGWASFIVAGMLTVGALWLATMAMTHRRRGLERFHADALEQANEQLQRSNRDLGHFAAVASHDLKAPLRRAVTFTQLLQRRLGDDTDEEIDSLLEVIVENGKHMQQLVNNLLSYSSLDQRLNHTHVDLATVFEGVRSDVEPELEGLGGRLSIDVNGAVMGTRAMLRELFSNLVGNALRYSRPDVAPRISIKARSRGRDMVISVKDNGMGIPDDQQARIFEMFTRAHAQKDGDPGTGIGLATCRRIAELHRGSISVKSQLGKGSTFTVHLPRAGSTDLF